MSEHASLADRAAVLRADQIERWRLGERPLVEDYLARETGLADDAEAVLELLYNEVVVREELGEKPGVEEYVRRFPDHAEAVRRQFELHGLLDASALGTDGDTPTEPEVGVAHRPALPSTIQDSNPPPPGGLSATEALQQAGPARSGGPTPMHIGRYEVLEELGQGGMGVVYKARQPGLSRLVALKVIRATDGRENVERFLTEARAAARLQHPSIVQIYEVGEE
jgi:hypothetical protein